MKCQRKKKKAMEEVKRNEYMCSYICKYAIKEMRAKAIS